MGQDKRSPVRHSVPLLRLVKIVYSVAPPKYTGGGHSPSQYVLYICKLCLVPYVQMYIVPGPGIPM